MSPRKYEKKQRAASTEETRLRILKASLALHNRQGFAATTWQDIAQEADVAVGTVYYHFPTIDELVPACAGLAGELRPRPTTAIFDGVRGRRARIETLVRELFGFYGLAGEGLANVFRERHRLGVLTAIVREIDATVALLTRAALGDDVDDAVRKSVEAMVDIRVYESFKARGLDEGVIVEIVARMIRDHVARAA